MTSWSVVGKGSASSVQVDLKPGAALNAEPDALISMTEGIRLGAQMDAGVVGGIIRSMLGNESIFSQTLSAPVGHGAVLIGAPDIGDVELLQLSPNGHMFGGHSSVLLMGGAFLAADETVEIRTTTQRSIGRALFSGTGLFLLRASGSGKLAIAAHGSILQFNLAPGETRAVDNGHLVAWDESMAYEMKMAGGVQGDSFHSKLFKSAASGEGLMCYFRGPGSLWLQTHKKHEESKDRRSKTGSGVVGGCIVILVFMIFFTAAVVLLVVIPAYGGRWVANPHSDGWTLEWDQPKTKPRSRLPSAIRRRKTDTDSHDFFDEL